MMKLLSVALLGAALLGLSGCVAYPVDGYYQGHGHDRYGHYDRDRDSRGDNHGAYDGREYRGEAY
jgi:hypothetical protein